MPKYKRTDTHKQCCKCGEIKPLSDFYSTPRGKGMWYSGRCKPCHLDHCRQLRNSEHGKEVYKQWTQSDSGKESIRKRMDKWRTKNKEKRTAHSAVSNAIRDNRLIRKPCRICGNPFGEAHHISYDDPFNIDWLCKSCHTNLHYPKITSDPDV